PVLASSGPVSPARPSPFAVGSTSLLIGAVVLVRAAGSFGAVRAWFPKVRAAPAAAPGARDLELPRPIESRTAAGRLSIVTDPAGARVEVDGRPQGLSPVVIDGLAAAEHRITVMSDSGVAQRTIAVSNGVV